MEGGPMPTEDDEGVVLDLVKSGSGNYSLLKADPRYIERGAFHGIRLWFRRLFRFNSNLADAAHDYADLVEGHVRVGQAQMELEKVVFDLSKIDEINLEREAIRKAEHKARLRKIEMS
jgi:hypothetical protein